MNPANNQQRHKNNLSCPCSNPANCAISTHVASQNFTACHSRGRDGSRSHSHELHLQPRHPHNQTHTKPTLYATHFSPLSSPPSFALV